MSGTGLKSSLVRNSGKLSPLVPPPLALPSPFPPPTPPPTPFLSLCPCPPLPATPQSPNLSPPVVGPSMWAALCLSPACPPSCPSASVLLSVSCPPFLRRALNGELRSRPITFMSTFSRSASSSLQDLNTHKTFCKTSSQGCGLAPTVPSLPLPHCPVKFLPHDDAGRAVSPGDDARLTLKVQRVAIAKHRVRTELDRLRVAAARRGEARGAGKGGM